MLLRLRKINWKLLLAMPLVVSCIMIAVGGPVRPVFYGCAIGVLVRVLLATLSPA
jgi:hypothetical protein